MSRSFLPDARPRPRLVIGSLGSLDIVLVIAVVLTAWLRTPVGELGGRAASWVLDRDRDASALTSYYLTGPLSLEALAIDQASWLPDLPSPPDGGFPEPWRTAARRVFADEVPEAALAALATLEEVPTQDRAVAALDVLYEGDPERALELAVLGEELRGRAVKRARAAGSRDPESYLAYRRFLPSSDAARADALVGRTSDVARELYLFWPVQGAQWVSSVFGMRQHPVYDKLMFHNGIDLAIPVGTPLHSVQAGVVVSVGSDDRSGTHVSIRHAAGVRTTYCHLDEALVEEGDTVRRGEIFARSGNTGASTGPHLHWIVRIDDKPVDPLPLRVAAWQEETGA